MCVRTLPAHFNHWDIPRDKIPAIAKIIPANSNFTAAHVTQPGCVVVVVLRVVVGSGVVVA